MQPRAKPRTTANPTAAPASRRAGDQFVLKALMISLAVVMLDVFGNRSAEMTFAKRNHAVEALVFTHAVASV
jgi:hypothetical protein